MTTPPSPDLMTVGKPGSSRLHPLATAQGRLAGLVKGNMIAGYPLMFTRASVEKRARQIGRELATTE